MNTRKMIYCFFLLHGFISWRIRTDLNSTFYFLFQKYPVMWQGNLGLKNDSSNVQMHFVSGNSSLVKHSMPLPSHEPPQLRIAQRMRLEPTQLDGVARRMQVR
jgi:hypothetical protein